MEPEFTACPWWEKSKKERCNQPAEIIGRYVLESSHGPIEFAILDCIIKGHSFNMPTAELDQNEAA